MKICATSTLPLIPLNQQGGLRTSDEPFDDDGERQCQVVKRENACETGGQVTGQRKSSARYGPRHRKLNAVSTNHEEADHPIHPGRDDIEQKPVQPPRKTGWSIGMD